MSALLMIPSEGGSISFARLTLVGLLLLLAGSSIYFGVRPPHKLDALARPGIIILTALLSLAFSLVLFFLRYASPERLLPVYERLSPLLWYLLVLSIQAVSLLLYVRYGFHADGFEQRKSIQRAFLVAFCILFFLFLFVVVTRLGVTPDKAYWGEPGVAMLGWQFALALLGGVVVFLVSILDKTHKQDIALPILIYLVAITFWLSVPLDVLTNGFYVTIDPPAFQPFPYSDAGYYDRLAHSLLIGQAYFGEIPARPLYIVFLTFLHLIFGENYSNIIVGQTFFLGLIPVVIYFLGKKLHSRVAGVIVALFFIFRELTSLWITSNTRVSNSKSLLTDLPTLFLLLLSCYFTIRWLEYRDRKRALLAGGMFGLLLLLRTQSLSLFPFIILAGLLVFGWRNRSFYGQLLFFFFGVVAALLPWLIHNYLLTGRVALDANFLYKLVASQYAYTGNLNVNFNLEGKGVAQILIEFAIKDPGFVFGFISNHFLATEIHGLLAMPLIKPYNGVFAPVNLYWMEWNGSLEWYNSALLLFYLTVISLGLGVAWKRSRWVGLLPLIYNLGYTLGTAVSRYSGWRYDFPADWVPYFYFGIGFAEIIFMIAAGFGARETTNHENVQERHPVPIPVYFALFALIGSLPWMAEKISTPRYTDQSPAFLTAQIASVPNAPQPADMQAFLTQPEAFLETGRALYPRFFIRDRGLFSSTPWPAYQVRNFPRIGFLLINQGIIQAVFPSREILEPFPQAGDAIVLGCKRDDYVEVRMIVFPEQDAVLLSAPLSEPCSP